MKRHEGHIQSKSNNLINERIRTFIVVSYHIFQFHTDSVESPFIDDDVIVYLTTPRTLDGTRNCGERKRPSTGARGEFAEAPKFPRASIILGKWIDGGRLECEASCDSRRPKAPPLTPPVKTDRTRASSHPPSTLSHSLIQHFETNLSSSPLSRPR